MPESEARTGLFVDLVDYRESYPQGDTFWTIWGSIMLVITIISYCPQPLELIQNRSNYGLAGASVFSQAICLFFVVFNVICLKFTDFVGLFEYPFSTAYSRFLTFLNVFGQWAFFLPCVFLVIIFHDKTMRPMYNEEQEAKARKGFVLWGILAISAFSFLLILWAIIGFSSGFDSKAIGIVGEISGLMATAMEFVQFIPQIWMTIKLKDHGSLSMLMLKIQAPTNLGNGIFMWLGQGESVTTFMASMMDAFFEFTLLGICYYFEWQKKHAKGKIPDYETVSLNLLGEIKPVDNNSKELEAL